MGQEMMSMTNKTCQQINEIQSSNSKISLKEMFQVIMEQMRRIVECHATVLDSVSSLLKKTPQQTDEDVEDIYTKEDVWSEVQTVVFIIQSHFIVNVNDSVIANDLRSFEESWMTGISTPKRMFGPKSKLWYSSCNLIS